MKGGSSIGSRSEEVELYLARALESVELAQKLLVMGYTRDALSKAYYAMFYAATAALRAEGVVVGKHWSADRRIWQTFRQDWQC